MSISPLSDAAYEHIRLLIKRDGLPRDARLPGENALADHCGVSRPVIRQALARLRAEGRVYARHGAGNFVGKTPAVQSASFEPLQSIPDMHSFLDFRCVIEGEAAARAAACRDKGLLQAISDKCRALEGAFARGDPAIEEDIAFHLAVAQASGNEFFVMTMAALMEQTRMSMGLVRKLSAQPMVRRARDVKQEHRLVERSIIAGDADAARSAMTAHLRGGIARLFGREEAVLK
ncbi:MAG: hypothetical protein JWN73_4000 [Betaproteobacteria bacterium]|nr:hypothetical protein [Betaproteobacteria bacterium]